MRRESADPIYNEKMTRNPEIKHKRVKSEKEEERNKFNVFAKNFIPKGDPKMTFEDIEENIRDIKQDEREINKKELKKYLPRFLVGDGNELKEENRRKDIVVIREIEECACPSESTSRSTTIEEKKSEWVKWENCLGELIDLEPFITQSPFSFQSPIFFSAPAPSHNLQFAATNSKKFLFPNNQQDNTPHKPHKIQHIHQKAYKSTKLFGDLYEEEKSLEGASNQGQMELRAPPGLDHPYNIQNIHGTQPSHNHSGTNHLKDLFGKANFSQTKNSLFGNSTISTSISKPKTLFMEEKNSCNLEANKIGVNGAYIEESKGERSNYWGNNINNTNNINNQRYVNANTGRFKSFTPGGREPRSKLWQREYMQKIYLLKAQLPESPLSKEQYKTFTRNFKIQEKASYHSVKKMTMENLLCTSSKIHWRMILDLSNLAKRECKISRARKLFQIVVHLQPFAYQGWLDYATMEEEAGKISKARKLLFTALKFTPYNENLFIKCLRLEERHGTVDTVRRLLGTLKSIPSRNSWRLVLEGALFEGRCGNKQGCRRIFKHLMSVHSTSELICFEAAKYEERIGDIQAALHFTHEGLKNKISFPPLWILLFRLFIKSNPTYTSQTFGNLDSSIDICFQNVSMENAWKINLELAQMFEYRGNIENSRRFISETLYYYRNNPNILWKSYTIGARIESRIGNPLEAKILLNNGLKEVGEKHQSIVLLELAKLYEVNNDLKTAQMILFNAIKVIFDWKLHFETIQMLTRNSQFPKALEVIEASLKIHYAIGRIWASKIQIHHAMESELSSEIEIKSSRAHGIFIEALSQIPKSGEVWNEGAKLCMNPYSICFNLEEAEKYLNFAIQFTHQYGDSFIELLRLYMIQGRKSEIKQLKNKCVHSEPNYGILWFYCKKSNIHTTLDIWRKAKEILRKEIARYEYLFKMKVNKEILPDTIYKKYFYGGILKVGEMMKGFDYKLDREERARIIYGFEQIVN